MTKLQQLAVIKEYQFASRLPLVAKARAAWSNVAARWLVREMFQQQVAFNQAVAQILGEQEEQLVAQDRELVALTKRLASLQRQSAKQAE